MSVDLSALWFDGGGDGVYGLVKWKIKIDLLVCKLYNLLINKIQIIGRK